MKRRRIESLELKEEAAAPLVPIETQIEEVREVAAKRQRLSHELFQVPKLTMREGIVRVLETKLDPSLMRALEDHLETGNASSDEEAQS